MCVTAAVQAAVTVTDENGVCYDIVGTSFDVVVSSNNKSLFSTRQVDVVIPATVTDVSTTGSEIKTYTVTGMATNCFQNTIITSLTIEAPFEIIPARAFEGCQNLTTVTLNPDIKTIDTNAFHGCSELLSVTGHTGLTTIGTSCFEDCVKLQSFDVPEGVTKLSSRTFSGCTALQTVTLPPNLTSIADRCFLKCASLQAPGFPASLDDIGVYAFSECTSLGNLDLSNIGKTSGLGATLGESVFLKSHITDLIWPETPLKSMSNYVFSTTTGLKTVTLPAWLKTLPHSSFISSADLETVNIPDGVEEIYYSAFNNCQNLTTLNFAQTAETPVTIYSSAFASCTSLSTINWPPKINTIKQKAFNGCSSLTDLVLPPMELLETEAFTGTDLNSITFPDTPITTIQTWPFGGQNSVTSMTFPGWMETIPSSICNNWAKLRTVVLNEGVKEISTTCFSNCYLLESVTLPSTLETIGQSGFSSARALASITFPEGLKTIGEYAFNSSTALTEIILPKSLTTLGKSAFAGCSAITKLTIQSENDLIIGESAFWSNKALVTVEMTDNVIEIGASAFASSIELKSFPLPAKLQTIGAEAFKTCKAFTSIAFNPGMSVGENAFDNSGIETITFPAEPCTFGNYVFKECSNLGKVTFPDWMTEIPYGICYRCYNIESVTLPDNLTTIGEYAFNGCSKLHDVTFPSTVTTIGANSFGMCNSTTPQFGRVDLYEGVTIGNSAFFNCTITELVFHGCADFGVDCFKSVSTISSIAFPECMEEIPQGFCSSWGALTTVTLGSKVKTIGKNAFYNCSLLTNIEFPETLEEIGETAFYQSGLVKINWPSHKITLGPSAFRQTKITKLEIPEWLNDIPESCFYGCTDMTTIDWGERTGSDETTVLNIGKHAFGNCHGLTEIVFPDYPINFGDNAFDNSNKLAKITFSHTAPITLGYGAFQNCNVLAEVNIPPTLSDISSRCFFHDYKLSTIVWEPRSGTDEETNLNIGEEAFSSSAFTSIEFPDYPIAFVGKSAFSSCTKLTSVKFSETAPMTLGNGTFQYCSSLTTVNFPSTITEIPNDCFYNDKKLALVDMSGSSVKTIGSQAFYSIGTDPAAEAIVLKWPPELESLGHSSFKYSAIEELTTPTTVSVISDYCFSNCSRLHTLTITDNITAINREAFSNCSALTTLDIPGTVKSLGISAFSSCTSLADLNLGEGLEGIGGDAFRSCSSLTEVTIPQSVTSLGSDCFASCTSLKSVVNHGDVEIPVRAFNGDTALESFYSDGAIYKLMDKAFGNCSSLATFEYVNEAPISALNNNVFEGCSSLLAFDYLVNCDMSNSVFKDCTSLRQMTMPVEGPTVTKNGFSPRNTFDGCTSLQSIIWPQTTQYFQVYANEINNAPLEALSYSYAKNITVPTAYNTSTRATIRQYTAEPKVNVTTPDKSILMVQRGEKYKYVEYGYGEVFNIIEMRNPQFNITGDIWSAFDPVNNVNHYKSILRWDVPLSDLNPNGPTKVTVRRDGEPVATVEFTLEPEPQTVEGLPSESVYVVDVKVNGKPNSFVGDFDFPLEENNETTWLMVYNTEGDKMYFDANSEKRLQDFDKFGYTSWFTLVDEFDSPDLNSENVPESYIYTATMEGYEYQELENNENLEIGDDGKRYHLVTKSFESIDSDPLKLHVAFGAPSLQFTGLYTTEEVIADRNGALQSTPEHTSSTRYNFTYSIDPDLVAQRVRIYKSDTNYSTENIYSTVDIYDVTDGVASITTQGVLDDTKMVGQTAINRNALGTIAPSTNNENYVAVEPGRKYLTVVSSRVRGTFGSPVMTIPGRPRLTAFVTAEVHEHQVETEAPTMHATLSLMPEFTDVGYDEGEAAMHSGEVTLVTQDEERGFNPVLTAGDYYYGIWRDINVSNTPSLISSPMRAAAQPSGTLIHHSEGVSEDGTNTICSSCADQTGFTTDTTDPGEEENPEKSDVYHDYYDLQWGQAHEANYTGRLYVKVPKSMLPGQEMWMVSDANTSVTKDILMGVEEISADDADEEGTRWFDMRGIETIRPLSGVPYIRVRRDGTVTKVIIK